MKTNYKDFIKINESIDTYQLAYKISTMGNWLYRYNGLDLMNTIDEVLDEYKTKLDSDEIKTFQDGLSALRLTNYPISDMRYKLSKKLPYGISNATNIKVNGVWSIVNKLNTNVSDLSELIAYLIDRMISDRNKVIRDFGNSVYKSIMMEGVENGLLMLIDPKDRLKKMIKYYFIETGNGLDDFLKFTKNIEENSKKGEISENKIRDYLIDNGFTLEFQGGNGDRIDMIFGCDLIMYREDIGYKTIQVKSYLPKQKDVEYYKIDWIAVSNDTITILDKNTFQPINING